MDMAQKLEEAFLWGQKAVAVVGEATVEHQKGKVIGMCSSLVLISYYRYPF